MRCQTLNPTLQMTAEINNDTLIMIEDMCSLMTNLVLSSLGITAPNHLMRDAFNHELQREKQYDTEELTEIHSSKNIKGTCFVTSYVKGNVEDEVPMVVQHTWRL